MDRYMTSEQFNLEQMEFVRHLGEGASSRSVDLYKAPDGSFRVIKWFNPLTELWRGPDVEESILSDIRSKRELSDYVVKNYGRFGDSRQGIGLVLEAFVPETGYLPFETATLREQSVLEALTSTEELAKAINALHAAGYANSDFQSSQIFVTRDAKKLKITDFNQASYQDPRLMLFSLASVANIVKSTFDIIARRVESDKHPMEGMSLYATEISGIIRDNLPQIDTTKYPQSSDPDATERWRDVAKLTEDWYEGVMNTSQKIRSYRAEVESIPTYSIKIGYLQGRDEVDWLSRILQREYGGQVLETSTEGQPLPSKIVGTILLQTDKVVTASDISRLSRDPMKLEFNQHLIGYGQVLNVDMVTQS